MKDFIEYLIEKKLITEEAALGAMIGQASKAPSMLEIVFAKRLMPTTHALKAALHQARHQCAFKAACESLGYWNADLSKKIQDELDLDCPSLTQVIVDLGLADYSALNQALDEYITMKTAESGASNNLLPASAPPSPSEPTVPSLEIMPNVESLGKGGGQQATVEEYQIGGNINDLLSDQVFMIIEESLGSLKTAQSIETARPLLAQLFHEFHKIKSIATFVGASELAMIAEKAEEFFQKAMNAPRWEPACVDKVTACMNRITNLIRSGDGLDGKQSAAAEDLTKLNADLDALSLPYSTQEAA